MSESQKPNANERNSGFSEGLAAPGSKALPGHIQARLDRLKLTPGGAVDSAGIPWEGRDLSGPGNPMHKFDNDDGLADPDLVAGVDEFHRTGDEAAVVAGLAQAKVYAAVTPTVVAPVEGAHGLVGDKEADVALITLSANDGRQTLPIFSSVERLTSWHPDARPVVVYAPRAALAAVSEKAELMVLDPGTDTPFVIRRPAVWSLAKQREWIPSYRNQEVAAQVSQVVELLKHVEQVRIMPAAGIATERADGAKLLGGGSGPELHLEVTFGAEVSEAERQRELDYLQQVLSHDPEFLELVDSLHLSVGG
ncbi:SseB family protein [Micrococcoides hystricis]|uniref:SseB family protein n=1 Tax=Micrococcoides hystricis TaxID=1572761 RepID=A0ABV6P8P5_9MICC